MAYRVINRADAMLTRLDKHYGLSATYKVPTGSTLNVTTGATVVTFDETTGIKVRPAKLSVTELSSLSQAGFTQIDQVWKLRKAYAADVRPGHLLDVGGFLYEIIEGGIQLDELQLEWTLFTRRRR